MHEPKPRQIQLNLNMYIYFVGQSVPVPLIIAGVGITTIVIITIVCFAVSGKFSNRTRKRAQRQLSRSSLGSRVSMRSSTLGSRVTVHSSRTRLPYSVASLRSHKRGSPLFNSKVSLPELIVTNVEGKQTRIFPERVETRAFIHKSPHSRRRHHIMLNHRRLSAENIIHPTPPPHRRNVTHTNWDVYRVSRNGRLSQPTSPSVRRHSMGSVKGDVITWLTSSTVYRRTHENEVFSGRVSNCPHTRACDIFGKRTRISEIWHSRNFIFIKYS